MYYIQGRSCIIFMGRGARGGAVELGTIQVGSGEK